MFLDALPLVNTEASVNVMSALITDGDVSAGLSHAWLTSLSFVTKPTAGMLLSAQVIRHLYT